MTPAQEKAIGDANLLTAELAGMLSCLSAYAGDRHSSVGGPLIDALAACERLARMAADILGDL